MSKIRINELAREVEVKSKSVIDYLSELGHDFKSHSSTLDDDLAAKVRRHFQTGEISPPQPAPSSAHSPSLPATKAIARAATPPEARVAPKPAAPEAPEHWVRHDAGSMTKSIDEIIAETRKSLAMKKQSGAHAVAPAAAGPGAPASAPRAGLTPARGVPVAPTRPAPIGTAARPVGAGAPTAKTAAPTMSAAPTGQLGTLGAKLAQATGMVIPAARHTRGTSSARSPAANQPIYQPSPTRRLPSRPGTTPRPGEHRPQHPTSTRPAPGTPQRVPAGHPAAGRAGVSAPRFGPRPAPARPVPPEEIPITHSIVISEGISIKELSEKLDARAKDVIKKLLDKGIFATINQTLDSATATEISRSFGADTKVISFEEEVTQEVVEADRPEDLKPRAPVVTVMGHVDHGKTSLLDSIRETSVAAREAGGITQHIGAYHVGVRNRQVVFLDTPGHEAFTLMRARGARVTDIVVLVVAADDGVIPQTLEAINHARAAKVPIIVAINKIDKPEAQVERVKKQLADQDLLAEDYGGKTVMVGVSAKHHTNLDLLLEMILLVADLQELRANPNRAASGTVLEGRLDRGRGPVATVLNQNGTLHVGDAFIVGAVYGKVRALFDDHGRPTEEAPPSTPVEVLGLEDVPQAGDHLQVIEDTIKARQISIHRLGKLREAALAKSARLTLEQLHEKLAAGEVRELGLIIKADVQGSVEALTETLNKLSTDKVKVKVIHAGVGAITETDVLLASASNAVVIGFNVRPERKATELAQLEKVDVRLHTIIYNVIDEIKKAMTGLLAVTIKEVTTGHAEIREVFRISKVGMVAGCYVQDGKFTRDSKIRLLRDNVVIHQGRIRSLHRFKDDVPEVRSGMECGIALENYSDVKASDVIEAFAVERVAEPVLV